MIRKAILSIGACFTLFLLWFALYDYSQAGPAAEEQLQGLALSMAAAIENLAATDPSLAKLASFHPADLAYFALIDGKGIYRFHSNPDLIGTPVRDRPLLAQLRNETAFQTRVRLGTGERAFEYVTPFRLPGEPLFLCLALHTYRADAALRRANLNATILISLVVAGWVLVFALYRYARREELHQQEMARRESLARLGEMGAMLAHEIRNPLSGIKGFAQVILKRPTDERNERFAGSIVTEARRLESLVEELLAYASPAASPQAAVDVCELITHTGSLLAAEAAELAVEVTADCGAGGTVTGNRDRLEQLLLNLGKNALQAMPDGGRLRIAAEREGKMVLITTTDTGAGIAAADLERVFEPFFTTKARGTGLGLALCRKVAEEHGGAIELVSRPGAGTVAKLRLPRAKE
ncbi:sensor histidine kinase [Geomonas sp. Red276]